MIRTAVILLLLVGFIATTPAPCAAATAKINQFHVVLVNHGWFIVHDDITYDYEASWSTPGLQSEADITWYENSLPARMIYTGIHTTSPVSDAGLIHDPPQTEAAGSYYKISVFVLAYNPIVIHAQASQIDSDWY